MLKSETKAQQSQFACFSRSYSEMRTCRITPIGSIQAWHHISWFPEICVLHVIVVALVRCSWVGVRKLWNPLYFNTLRPRQNGRHFADDIFNRIFLNENIWIPIKISLRFVPKGPINNNPSLVQIMAWRRPGDKPLSEPVIVSLLTHVCVTRPQWVKSVIILLGAAR